MSEPCLPLLKPGMIDIELWKARNPDKPTREKKVTDTLVSLPIENLSPSDSLTLALQDYIVFFMRAVSTLFKRMDLMEKEF